MVLVTYKKSQHSKPKHNSSEPKYCNYHYKIITLTTTTIIIIIGTASLSFQYDRKIRQRDSYNNQEIMSLLLRVKDQLAVPALPVPPLTEYRLSQISTW